jgi:hypothetical protein
MYCGINVTAFPDVPGLSALLSAAEMLQPKCPLISGSFVHYALALLQRSIASSGRADLSPALLPLQQTASQVRPGSAGDLERFGDALCAIADGRTAADFYRLAYLAYASTSLFGQPSPRILQKITKTQQSIGSNSKGAPQAVPAYATGPSGYPTDDDADLQIPSMYPGVDDESLEIPSGYPGGIQIPASGGNGPELTNLAYDAFCAGADDIALAAIGAALQEFQRAP